MLGKLICYDGKRQLRFLAGMYAVAGILALVCGGVCALRNHFSAGRLTILVLMSKLTGMLCAVSAVAVVMGSVIYVVLYFRKNLLRDEGYLMHTLPVTAFQLYLSKLITGTLAILLSIAVAVFCVELGSLQLGYPLSELFGSGLGESDFFKLLTVTILVALPANLCQFYASLTLGYTWNLQSVNPVNKDLLSVIVYVIMYMVQQAAAFVSLILYMVVRYGNPFDVYYSTRMEELVEGGSGVLEYVQGIVGLSLGLSIIFGVVWFALGVYRMKRHLNLE